MCARMATQHPQRLLACVAVACWPHFEYTSGACMGEAATAARRCTARARLRTASKALFAHLVWLCVCVCWCLRPLEACVS